MPLNNSQIDGIFVVLDVQLNRSIFAALLYGKVNFTYDGFQEPMFKGIYTGVVAVTLWAVGLCSSPL